MSYSKVRTVLSFFNYWLHAVDAHSLQSPFSFEFYQNVIAPGRDNKAFSQIEELRQKLKRDSRRIEVRDYGAGSKNHASNQRKIADIVRYSVSSSRLSQMLLRLAHNYKPQTIVELGTSLGINTLYLAKGCDQGQVTTFEGCPRLASVAKENFKQLKQDNIQVIEGDLDHSLPTYLATIDIVDLVFFDANHRYEPTVRYFNQCLEKAHHGSIFIFDDIHWSAEMEKAWSKIKSETSVSVSFDLFQAGIVFFVPTTKQEFVLEAPFWFL